MELTTGAVERPTPSMMLVGGSECVSGTIGGDDGRTLTTNDGHRLSQPLVSAIEQ